MKRFKWGFGIAWHVGSFFVGHSYYMVVISLTAYSLSNHFCFSERTCSLFNSQLVSVKGKAFVKQFFVVSRMYHTS